MFRYRQTQHLQRDLEKRFGKLLKPFGIGTEKDEKTEPDRERSRMPERKSPGPAPKPVHDDRQAKPGGAPGSSVTA